MKKGITRVPNAQKWTAEKVSELLKEIFELSHHPNFVYLGQVLASLDLYNQVWAYWRRIFSDNEDIRELMYQIDQQFESRIVEAGMKKFAPASFAKFVLQCKYGWSIEPEPDPEEVNREPLIVKMPEDTFLFMDGTEFNGRYRKLTDWETWTPAAKACYVQRQVEIAEADRDAAVAEGFAAKEIAMAEREAELAKAAEEGKPEETIPESLKMAYDESGNLVERKFTWRYRANQETGEMKWVHVLWPNPGYMPPRR